MSDKWYFFRSKNGNWGSDLTFIVCNEEYGYIFDRKANSFYGDSKQIAYKLSRCREDKCIYKETNIPELIKLNLLRRDSISNLKKMGINIIFSDKKLSDFPPGQITDLLLLLKQNRAFCADSAFQILGKDEELVYLLAENKQIKESKCSPGCYFVESD